MTIARIITRFAGQTLAAAAFSAGLAPGPGLAAPADPSPAPPPSADAAASPADAASPTPPASHAAAHHGRSHHRRHLVSHRTGVQPLPPPAPVASNTSPAPVPNEALSSPRADQPAPETSVAPSVFQLHYPPQGDGYVTGSSPQAMDDRNAAKATGVQVQVPLPQ